MPMPEPMRIVMLMSSRCRATTTLLAGAPVLSEVSVVVPTPTEIFCDRVLVDELLDFFKSPHLKERAAQLTYLSEMLLLRSSSLSGRSKARIEAILINPGRCLAG